MALALQGKSLSDCAVWQCCQASQFISVTRTQLSNKTTALQAQLLREHLSTCSPEVCLELWPVKLRCHKGRLADNTLFVNGPDKCRGLRRIQGVAQGCQALGQLRLRDSLSFPAQCHNLLRTSDTLCTGLLMVCQSEQRKSRMWSTMGRRSPREVHLPHDLSKLTEADWPGLGVSSRANAPGCRPFRVPALKVEGDSARP